MTYFDKKSFVKYSTLRAVMGAAMGVFVLTSAASAQGTAGYSQRVSKVNGENLEKFCSQKETRSVCHGYIAGVIDGTAVSRDYAYLMDKGVPPAPFCIPQEQTTEQIRNVVLAWLGAHRDGLKETAGRVVYRALHDNYPCPALANERTVKAPVTGEKGN